MTAQGPSYQFDRFEFEVFFERHVTELGRLAYLLTGNQATAEELTGEVLRAMWQQRSAVAAVGTPFGHACGLMVDAVAGRRWRLAKRDRSALRVESRQLAARWDPRAQDSVNLRSALLSLPLRWRACVVLRQVLQLSEIETAQAVGISVGTVRRQVSRGTARLRKRLGASESGGKTP